MNKKIIYLDGLRGTAAFIVVITHFFQVFAPYVFEGNPEIIHFGFEQFAAQTPINLLFNGNFAVCLFFVLSGYVLSHRYFQSKDRSIVYFSALKRYVRLAVPAFASVLIAYLIMVFGLGYYNDINGLTRASMPDPYQADPSILTLVREGLFNTFFTHGSQYNPVLWTMTYELFGSFIIFIFLIALGARRVRIIGYAALAWFFIDSYYLGFVLGMLLSDLRNSGRDWLGYIRYPWVNAALVIIGIYLGSYPYVSSEGTVYSVLVWGAGSISLFVFYHIIGSFLILTALLNSSRMQTLFSLKPFAYLGKVSFSLYLVHFTIICSFSSYLFLKMNPALPYGVNVLLTTVISLVLIFAAAHLFYRFIDAKTLAFLGRWRKRDRQHVPSRQETNKAFRA
ncbi:acyltransferase family protein [Paenibacillus marinisediminis]